MPGSGPGHRSVEFWLTVTGTVAGIIGAVAAVAVFVVPAKTSDNPGVSMPSTSSEGGHSGAETALPTTVAVDQSRYLSDLTPSVGAGFLHIEGEDLTISCPTNQSDDTYHEITYALPAAYSEFTTSMTVDGEADPEATASVQVFIQRRADRNDIQVQVGDPVVLEQGGSMTFSRSLAEAAQFTVRARCTSSTQVVVLGTPTISH